MKSLCWLLLSGCRKQCGSQPVGSCLAGIANRLADSSCFFRRQPNRKNNRDTFCREPGTAHFLFHTKAQFRKRKCLTLFWIFVYKRQVSKFETAPFQQSARTSLERLVTSDTRLEPGRAMKRLAMKAEALQVANSDRQSRSLKVEAIGDFARRKVIPRIRIAGLWLEQAGFKPGHRVQILIEQPGRLSLRFLEQGKEVAL